MLKIFDKYMDSEWKGEFYRGEKTIYPDSDIMMKISYENFDDNNYIIFGNLPYNISTQILAKWIKTNNIDKFCKRLILMFQKEVADRITAKPNTKNSRKRRKRKKFNNFILDCRQQFGEISCEK